MAVKACERKFNQCSQKSLYSSVENSNSNICGNTIQDINYHGINPSYSPYFAEGSCSPTKRRKPIECVSSVPWALNVYKANSDDFKNAKRKTKKSKKSVLTLPNEQAPLPQACTVSDMNDSEYLKKTRCDKESKRKKIKRNLNTERKCSNHNDVAFYGAMYSSQLDMNLGYNSTSYVKNFAGDCKKTKKLNKNNFNPISESNMRDVWSMIRNINKFQFQPSPPHSNSTDSTISVEIKKGKTKRRNIYKNSSLIETSQTEEFALISCYDVDDSSYSQFSFDKITVIDALNEQKDYFETSCDVASKKNTKGRNKSDLHKDISQYGSTLKDKTLKAMTCKDKINKFENIKDWIQKADPQSFSTEILRFEDDNVNFQNDKELISSNINENFNHRDSLIGSPKNVLKDCSVDCNITETKSNTFKESNNKTADCHRKGTVNNRVNGITKIILSEPENIKLQHENRGVLTESHLSKNINSSENLYTDTKNLKYGNVHKKIINPDVSNETQIKPVKIKVKTTEQIKNQMLKLMNRNSNNSMKYENIEMRCKNMSKDVSVNTSVNSIDTRVQSPLKQAISKFPYMKNPWAKAKQASDFIENVINKLKNGIYYSHDGIMKKVNHTISHSIKGNVSVNAAQHILKEMKEIKQHGLKPVPEYGECLFERRVWQHKDSFIKAKRNSEFVENVINKIKNGTYYTNEYKAYYGATDKMVQTDTSASWQKYIPGFEDTLSDFKVESLSRKQIIVKHCITNCAVKFDVIPSETERCMTINKSMSYNMPLLMLDNQSNMLKCEKTILNTQLPAQLCSILPDLKYSILNFNKGLCLSNARPEPLEYSEIINNESLENTVSFIPTPVVSTNIHGHFNKNSIMKCKNSEKKQNLKLSINIEINILPTIHTNNVFINKYIPIKSVIYQRNEYMPSIFNNVVQENHKDNAMSVQLYSMRDKQIVLAYKRFNLFETLQSLCYIYNLKLILDFVRNVAFWHSRITIRLPIMGVQTVVKDKRKLLCLTESDATVNDSKNTLAKHCEDSDTNCGKITTCGEMLNDMKRNGQSTHYGSKRKQIRQHKKSKSLSHITERSQSYVSLSNVSNLDDFYRVLGSAKTLKNVLDENSKKIILSSLAMMKNWIPHLTSSQAMLVLFLSTKKTSINLIRCRPLLLQGIAVNRITQISDLNMEIEVLEKEDFNKFPQYSGINLMPEYSNNRDALIEELIWIAKTTASDYRKPFDECSERHLRSLIEKRKSLNPSYLRVMARYAGLGLLKM